LCKFLLVKLLTVHVTVLNSSQSPDQSSPQRPPATSPSTHDRRKTRLKNRLQRQFQTGLNRLPSDRSLTLLLRLSLLTNAILVAAIVGLSLQFDLPSRLRQAWKTWQNSQNAIAQEDANPAEPGRPTPNTYQGWVELLGQEAAAIAKQKPENLYILTGDSITRWFLPKMLPPGATWLNQGISGDGSEGVYQRLKLFDDTEPRKVFVMIGINDLLRGMDDETLLENYRRIVKDILWIHPDTEVVVQSILPHGAETSTWEGKENIKNVSNERIRSFNDRLAAMADYEGVTFLDLHPIFADASGKLRAELTTDGLHLNQQGYFLWRSALMIFNGRITSTRETVEDSALGASSDVLNPSDTSESPAPPEVNEPTESPEIEGFSDASDFTDPSNSSDFTDSNADSSTDPSTKDITE